MPGNGHIGGGGSCDVEFHVTGEDGVPQHHRASDDGAEVGLCEVTVTFPDGSAIKSFDAKTNTVVVKLTKGHVVEFAWAGSGRKR